ncbi:MAG: class I SAM-dependent methyltransferase [Gammaproteobacteria bacterium]
MRLIALSAIAATMCLGTALAQMMPPVDEEATIGEQWDQRYGMDRYIYGTEPVEFLVDQINRLPRGRALCLAAGEGRNAVWLAQQGYEVTAMDASPVGLAKATALAELRGVVIETSVGDLSGSYDMGVEQYDVITNFYYHDTSMIPAVMRALKPGGVFILQNFSIAQLDTNQFGPSNPDFLVKPNELLQHFEDYRVLYYEDTVVELDEGMHQGPGAVVRLIVANESP